MLTPLRNYTPQPIWVPLLNTAVLLASGVSVTWAHHSIIQSDRNNTIQALLITIVLGTYFTFLQAIEYYEAPFTIADGIYGTTFFVATGFHGLHVIIGTLFLLICLLRQIFYHLTNQHHFGFEAAAWYWHFVDVVWLFLFISIYWWGSYFLITKSIGDFQSPDPSLNLGENNAHLHIYSPNFVSYFSPPKFLTPINLARHRKTLSIRVRIWPPRICSPTILYALLSGSHFISPLWPRNCPPTPTTLGNSITRPPHSNFLGIISYYTSFCRLFIWVTSSRSRMSRIRC